MKRLLLMCGFFAGCGHGDGDIDELVGSACASDRDCDNRCYTESGKFPGGFCSLSCASDADCPSDTYCMATEGGVCLFYCPEFDCARLGPAWECKEKDRQGGGKAFVCIGD